MTIRSWSLALMFCTSMVGAVGCGTEPETPTADPADFDSADTQEARTASWERLVGAWEETSGNLYAHLVFERTADNSGHHYFGMRVVQCVRAPCPPVREDGYFTVGSSTLNLRSGTTTQRLRYQLSSDNLTILSGDRVVSRLRRETSYCTLASDCVPQGATLLRCPGAFLCESNACNYRCGMPGPTCRTLTCATGMHCEMANGLALCSADPGRGYGATCGGIAGLQCDAGYTCVLEGTNPDASGHCHGLSTLGGSCGGGSIRYPAVCDTGLRCDGPAAGAPPGATGTCVSNGPTCATVRCAAGYHCEMTGTMAGCVRTPGDLGSTCGGIAGLRCNTGLGCYITDTHPDATGECRTVSNLGGSCGGTTRYPNICATGLRCVGPAAGAPLGASGTCQR